MSTYILIMVLIGYNGNTMHTAEFSSKTTCLAAAAAFKVNVEGGTKYAYCVIK